MSVKLWHYQHFERFAKKTVLIVNMNGQTYLHHTGFLYTIFGDISLKNHTKRIDIYLLLGLFILYDTLIMELLTW